MIRLSKGAFAAWIALAAIVAATSFAIVVQGSESQDKFQITETTKPKTSSLTFTGLPVEFDKDNDVQLTSAGTADSEGLKIISGQKILLNVVGDKGEEIDITVPIVNHSADPQIILIECTAPNSVAVDIEPQDAFVTTDGLRLVEKNTWILNVKSTNDASAEFNLEVIPKESGAFQVMCQIKAVG